MNHEIDLRTLDRMRDELGNARREKDEVRTIRCEDLAALVRLATPRPAVAMPSINAQDTDVRIQPKGWRLIHETPTDEILDILRWHLNEACQGPPFFPEIVFNALLSALPDPNPYQIEAAPAGAMPAEVTK